VADEKIIDRVRKLLAKAEGTDNEEEAATFLNAALKMMERHALDEAMVRAGAGQAPAEIINWQWVVQGDEDHCLARITAAYNVASALGCDGVIVRDRGNLMDRYLRGDTVQGESTLHLFGTGSAIEHSQLLIASLSLQWEAAATKAAEATFPEPVPGYGMKSPLGQWNDPLSYRFTASPVNDYLRGMLRDAGVSESTWNAVYGRGPAQSQQPDVPLAVKRAKFANSYILGYSHRVNERLKNTRQEIQDEVAGAALVHLDDAARAKTAMFAAFPQTGRGRSIDHDLAGYRAGNAAGSSADLGGSNVGGYHRPELGS
jgi:hypothetical protein